MARFKLMTDNIIIFPKEKISKENNNIVSRQDILKQQEEILLQQQEIIKQKEQLLDIQYD